MQKGNTLWRSRDVLQGRNNIKSVISQQFCKNKERQDHAGTWTTRFSDPPFPTGMSSLPTR